MLPGGPRTEVRRWQPGWVASSFSQVNPESCVWARGRPPGAFLCAHIQAGISNAFWWLVLKHAILELNLHLALGKRSWGISGFWLQHVVPRTDPVMHESLGLAFTTAAAEDLMFPCQCKSQKLSLNFFSVYGQWIILLPCPTNTIASTTPLSFQGWFSIV